MTDTWRADYQLFVDACTSADAEEREWAWNVVFTALTPYSQNPLLPITVVDQLHLWDKERNRLNMDEGPSSPFLPLTSPN